MIDGCTEGRGARDACLMEAFGFGDLMTERANQRVCVRGK